MKILVVDDEKMTQPLFEKWFKPEITQGLFDFNFVLCGEDALVWLENRKEAAPLLILADIKMTGIDGLELLKLLKKVYPQYPVIMLTAYGDDSNYSKAIQFGADDFMVKPIAMSILRRKLIYFITKTEAKK